MTREERIEKVQEMLVHDAIKPDPKYTSLAEKIVDALEEEPEQFFAKEVVMCPHLTTTEGRYSLYESHIGIVEKLPTRFLAATIGARIEGAKWWSIDAEGLMEWWREEPAWCEGKEPGELRGWIYGGIAGDLRTNIRQEPEKGEL
jgi:hypothetical protein